MNATAKAKHGLYTIAVGISICWLLCAFYAAAEGQEVTKTEGPTSFQMPSWLKLSVGVTETYDDNLYQSGVAAQYLPASYTVPPGSVAALKGLSSVVTTVSPTIAVDVAPLLGNQNILQEFSLAYAPDFNVFHQESVENYIAHGFPITVKGKWDSLSFSAVSGLTFIEGSNVGPTYPGALLNAYATNAPRWRRKQINDQAAVVFQYDYDKWFFRPTASLLYYDMMTALLDVTGYQNYVGRYDINGGADFGYRVEPQLAVTLGYRYGHQYQELLPFSPYSSSSDYQRVLAGVEGQPWQWLKVQLQGGPDFRSYADIAAVSNKHPVYYYGDASLTATITTEDTLVFGYHQFQWVSQLGQIPYFDSAYHLSYHRGLSDRLGLDLQGSILSSDYTAGDLPASHRDDLGYSFHGALSYSFNAHISANLAYSFDAGRNDLAGVVNPQTRAFNRSLISIATQIKF